MDWNQFIKSTNFISDPNCTQIKHYTHELIEALKEDGAIFGYDFAKYIIQTYSQHYDLRFLKVDKQK